MSKSNKKFLELMDYYKSLGYLTLEKLNDVELIELIILYRRSHSNVDPKIIQLLMIVNTLMHNKSKTVRTHALSMFNLLREDLFPRIEDVYKRFIDKQDK